MGGRRTHVAGYPLMHAVRVPSLRTLIVLGLTVGTACHREAGRIRLGTTTSVQDSGLLEVLLPAYRERTRTEVDVIAVGTGAAFKLARDGNVDLLLVHDREGEEEFVASGDGLERRELMWNTFEILGPGDDPARVRSAGTAAAGLARIAATGAAFVSRGDDSGTHRREKRLWEAGGGRPAWPGYRETGQGMGATLTVADEIGAYVLADRGTRLAFAQKLRLLPLLADTPELRNEYSVVLINPAKHPQIGQNGARRLADWLAGPEAARLIAGFRVGGEQLFHPVRAER